MSCPRSEQVSGQLAAGLLLVDVDHGLSRNPWIQPALVTTGSPASCAGSISIRWVGTSTTTPSTPASAAWRSRRRHFAQTGPAPKPVPGVTQPARLMLEREDPSRRAEEPRPQGQHTDCVAALPRQRLRGHIRTIAELSIARFTRSRTSERTCGASLTTRDTVFWDTPAAGRHRPSRRRGRPGGRCVRRSHRAPSDYVVRSMATKPTMEDAGCQ